MSYYGEVVVEYLRGPSIFETQNRIKIYLISLPLGLNGTLTDGFINMKSRRKQ